MVSLDFRIAGCVSRWPSNGGRIEDRAWDTLAECEQLLNRLLPALDGYELSFYQRLLDMTVLIPENPDDLRPE